MSHEETRDARRSSRTFQLWGMAATHGQLLLRSNKGEGHETRIDIAFKTVDALHLKAVSRGLAIRRADGDEAARILAGLDRSLLARNLFICESGAHRGYVVAALL